MVRILTLCYRGTDFAGWQRQANAVTIQQRVEEALSRLAGKQIRVVGAGRTDAGVHARGQVAHLVASADETDASAVLELPERALVHGTNRHLSPDIRVLKARWMPEGFHARKSTSRKLYSYRMVPVSVLSPLERLFAIQVDPRIDVGAMRTAALALIGRHDFSAFALSGGAHTDPRRRIFAAELLEGPHGLVFQIEGEGFLRGMVRALAGTLVEVGVGKRDPARFSELLSGGPRSLAGPTAPPQGLVLERVSYEGFASE